MIVKLQCLIFLVFGFLCWHGVDDVIEEARQEAQAGATISILLSMPIGALPNIKVGES